VAAAEAPPAVVGEAEEAEAGDAREDLSVSFHFDPGINGLQPFARRGWR
jgi:hypothetical protein